MVTYGQKEENIVILLVGQRWLITKVGLWTTMDTHDGLSLETKMVRLYVVALPVKGDIEI